MVARATSAQSFLRTLPHTLLRLVPPSAGRPRCVAPPSRLSVSTRSAFFRQVRHEKRMPFVSLHGCAGYFGATVSPHAPPHPLAPRAAFGGATALRCSAVPALCFHAQRVFPAGPPRKKEAFRPLPLHGCAGYFGAIVSPHAPPHPVAPRAAFGGATALRCSTVPALCFHAQRVLPAGPPRKKDAFRLPAWLRGLLRRNRFSARSPTPSCASCRLRRGDRVALLRRPSSLFPRAARSSGRSTTKKNAASAAFFCGGPARARTAVLQSSSADTTRLVCDQISPAGSPQTTCSLGTLP